jgi:hypothetical protein
MKNDGNPDDRKFLGITPRKIRVPDNQYVWTVWVSWLKKGVPAYTQNHYIL